MDVNSYIHNSAMALALVVCQPIKGDVGILFRHQSNKPHLFGSGYVFHFAEIVRWWFYRRAVDLTRWNETQFFLNSVSLWESWWSQLVIVWKLKNKKPIILLSLPIVFCVVFTSSKIQLLITWLMLCEKKVFLLQLWEIQLFWYGWKTTLSQNKNLAKNVRLFENGVQQI